MKLNKFKLLALVASFFIICGCNLMGIGADVCIIQPEHGKLEVSLIKVDDVSGKYSFLITAIPEEGYTTDIDNIFVISDSNIDGEVYQSERRNITLAEGSGTKYKLTVEKFTELTVTARFYKVK